MKRYLIAALILTVSIWAFGQETEEEEEFVMAFLPTELQFNPIHTYTSTEAQVYTAIYEGLVSYHRLTMDPVPAVARRWQISPDGLTYQFYLRDDARYWNGDHVTAWHFRDTWLELLNPENNAAYSFLLDVVKGARAYRTGAEDDPSTVAIRAVSDTVLEVELDRPASHFLKILCHHSFVPIHPTLLNREDWSDLPSVLGNGPYYIYERGEDEIILTRNEVYWDYRDVEIPRIRFIFQDDATKTTEMFNNGEIHWVYGGISIEDVDYRETIVINPMFATTYFFFSTREEPWSDPRVRRAMALLLPWAEIRDPEILFTPAETLVPPIPDYRDVDGIVEQNREEALLLLDEAGYPGGADLPDITFRIPSGMETARVYTLMRETWEEELGITAEADIIPYPAYFSALSSPGYTLGTISWIGDFADPLTFLQMWTSDSNLNDSGYTDSEYDELIDEAIGMGAPIRFDRLEEAEEKILQSGLVLPISHSPAINLVDLNFIEGWYPNPLDIHPFKYLRFAEFRPSRDVASLRER
jgi:peptide/nickel transport system substrate-binding protein/oligopeptide transport system substrate-binding protein